MTVLRWSCGRIILHQNNDTLISLQGLDDQPSFDEAWQAQVLAIAQNLIDEEMIKASDWSNALGVTLRKHQVNADTDTPEVYYKAALEALETVLQDKCDVPQSLMDERKADWTHAYETTPHGARVELS